MFWSISISLWSLYRPAMIKEAPFQLEICWSCRVFVVHLIHDTINEKVSKETQSCLLKYRIYLSDLLACFGCCYCVAVVICCYHCLCWNNEWVQTSMRFEVDVLYSPAVNFSRLEKGCLRHCSQPFLSVEAWLTGGICTSLWSASLWRAPSGSEVSPRLTSPLTFASFSDQTLAGSFKDGGSVYKGKAKNENSSTWKWSVNSCFRDVLGD